MSRATQTLPKKYHVKRDDEVEVISGANKGKTGKVLQVLRDKGTVIIEGVNLRKKAVRPTQENQKGGFEEREMPIHASNVKRIREAASVGAEKKKK